ncbi:hypothetical protein GO986_17895 [Deinococcus sp. HMF7620]|uniref:Lipoprotein n=1 Tax=Deinococcus arboris TaxID=2682977 RepID=A0A7C9HTL0_9DEIO|nr:hypothetical protein [Deinococcus arboris]MVN88612.1 hypothetical protein [Deinococcus arboris]
MSPKLYGLATVSALLLMSCGDLREPEVQPNPVAVKSTNLNTQRVVPAIREPVDYITDCLENVPSSQDSTTGLDPVTQRSVRSSQWIKSALVASGLTSDVLGQADLGNSAQTVESYVENCGPGKLTTKNYVSKLVLKYRLSDNAVMNVTVTLSSPKNHRYETWMVEGVKRLYLMGTGTFNNIDNGQRVTSVVITQHVFSQGQLLYSGADVSSNITSPDPVLQSKSAQEHSFVFDGNGNIMSHYAGAGLGALKLTTMKVRSQGQITAQSLSSLAIVVTPTDPRCQTAGTLSSNTVGGISGQSIVVCPVIEPPFVYNEEPQYNYEYALNSCANEKYAVDRAETALMTSRFGIWASATAGGLAIGAVILGGPMAWMAFIGGGAVAGGTFLSFAPNYKYLEDDKRKAVAAYNICLQKNRTHRA